MSKKANPTVIGLFVVIAAVLAAAGVVLFSSARLFSVTETYVAYFDASVNGLDVGAPVKFRGVPIGQVKEIFLHYNQRPDDSSMPVVLELNEKLLREKSDRAIMLRDEDSFHRMVQDGLRAKLELESFVTGRLYVSLDLIRDGQPPDFHQIEQRYLEIPSRTTDIQQLMRNVAEFDLAGLTRRLDAVLDQLTSALGQLQVRDISQGLTNLLASMNRFVDSPQFTNTLTSADRTLNEFRHLSETVRHRVDPLAQRTDSTLVEASATLAELRKGIEDLRDILAPQAPFRRDLSRAVDELGQAAQSIGKLADSLTRNPNAILSGRKSND